MRRFPRLLAASLLAATVGGCSTNDGRDMQAPKDGQTETIGIATTTVAGQTTLTLTAPWQDGAVIDKRYTCDGENVSPALSWTGAPADVSAWALVLTDTEAPTFSHWAAANIDASAGSVAEGFTDDLVAVAMNSDAQPAYTGPCPPAGTTHRYVLTLYALSQVLEAQNGDPAPSLRAAIEAAAVATAQVSFSYSR